MQIGQLARLTATSIETIRFYEREHLLPAAPRSEGNYRIYGDEHVERLAFIRHCRSLDMALDEVRTLLRLREQPMQDCAGVNELLDQHIGHVASRIRELRMLEKQLKALREQCTEAQATSQCGILRELGDSTVSSTGTPAATRHVHGTHQSGRRAPPLN